MTNDYYSADQVFVSDAKIGSMTAWRNADAALIAGEVVASDEFINGALIEPIGYATGIGKADTYLPKYRTMFYSPGSWIETNYFQTGRRLFPAFGSGTAGTSTCTTTDDSPAGGYYSHAITVRNSQTPLWSGRLLARDNETNGEDEFISMLGMLPKTYHVECTEQSFIATQTMGWQVAFTSTTTTDVAEPTALTDVPFDWSNVSFPTFTYNSETIEADVLGVGIDIINNCRFMALDSSGYYTKGKMAGFQDIAVTLNIVPYGRNPFEVKRTKLESYATDIALTVKFTRDATYDYIQFAFTKMYLDPFEIIPGTAADWFEGYMVRLHLLSTGALTITVQDDYDDDYYET